MLHILCRKVLQIIRSNMPKVHRSSKRTPRAPIEIFTTMTDFHRAFKSEISLRILYLSYSMSSYHENADLTKITCPVRRHVDIMKYHQVT